MAIAFNIPSEREAPEENFSRLNRLLAELYEVLCHILVARPAGTDERQDREQDRERRERPFSESEIERLGFSGFSELTPQTSVAIRPRPISANSSGLPLLNLDFSDLDDDVFVSPRSDNGNDPFSNPRNVEIFGNPRNGSPRTPAGVLLSPRRERRFTFSGISEKHWRDKGGTIDEADGVIRSPVRSQGSDSDETRLEAKESISSESSLLSSILPDKLSGSICTAVLFVLGWKLLTNKR